MLKRYQFLSALILGCIFTLLTTPSTQGKEIALYQSPGVLAQGESQPVTQIQVEAGDVLSFSNGKSFLIRSILGGDSNLILDIGDGKILRIPKYWQETNRQTLKSYWDGYDLLVEKGLRVPKIFIEESDPEEYLVQEYLPIQFTAKKLRDLPEEDPLFRQAFVALLQFARETAAFELIGDIGPWQLGWEGSKWILLDWTRTHVLHDFEPWNEKSTFWPYFAYGLNPGEIERVTDEVVSERRRLRAALCESNLKN